MLQPRSLKVHHSRIETVRLAFQQSNFSSQQLLADGIPCCRDTIRKFMNGKGVDSAYFYEICKKLNLNSIEIQEMRCIPNNLPRPDYLEFIGRDDEQKKLLRYLSPEYSSPLITVDGIGGLGKTALVIAVAYKCLAATQGNLPDVDAPHFDAIVYTSAKQQYLTPCGLWTISQTQRNINDIVQEIGKVLRDDSISEAAPEEQFNCVRQSLSKQRTLLIVDNLETIEDKRSILEFLNELPGNVKSIVTTREQRVIHVHIRLSSLPEVDSIRLIRQQTHEKEINFSESDQQCLYSHPK